MAEHSSSTRETEASESLWFKATLGYTNLTKPKRETEPGRGRHTFNSRTREVETGREKAWCREEYKTGRYRNSRHSVWALVETEHHTQSEDFTEVRNNGWFLWSFNFHALTSESGFLVLRPNIIHATAMSLVCVCERERHWLYHTYRSNMWKYFMEQTFLKSLWLQTAVVYLWFTLLTSVDQPGLMIHQNQCLVLSYLR